MYNIILNITTFCNFKCSYCDVIKDNKILDLNKRNKIINFINDNKWSIYKFKFFWWEPLISWLDIKYIIDETNESIWSNYEIVTNTSLLNDDIWLYFNKYFKIIFFSIDSENFFDYPKVFSFIKKFDLKDKVFFNLIVSPWSESKSLYQFYKLYNFWYRNFNILPVYFTKFWYKKDLYNFSLILKKIIDLSLNDKSIYLYWFQENIWYNSSLDIDLNFYYSDFVTTYLWYKLKKSLYLWNIDNFKFTDFNYLYFKIILQNYEKYLIKNIYWQFELRKLMDYFSVYLNNKL